MVGLAIAAPWGFVMAIPNDPQFNNQWHLRAIRLYSTDPGNPSVWDDYTGRGINVGVYDNGVQATHPDLDGNYDAGLEYTGPGAGANADGGQHHGTSVAGIIAAEANGTDTVGIAYDAEVTGVRTDLPFSDAFFTGVMEHQARFDVVNHSWGSSPFWFGPTGSWFQRITDGIDFAAENGRFGLGTVIVAAAGNDRNGQQWGTAGDANVQAPHVGDRHTITVASAGGSGFVSNYSNPGANLLITAPSQGTWNAAAGGIVATDKTDNATAGYQNPDDGFQLGTVASNLQGTSFAAPAVTGVVALMLEANPLLGWRDVREILAATAVHLGSAVGGGTAGAERNPWFANGARDWNGGGHNFSEDYGFGGLDARSALRLAESWTEIKTSANEVGPGASFGTSPPIAITDNSSQSFTIDLSGGVDIETVEVRLGLTHSFAGDLRITLTSPSGTTTMLLNRVGSGADVNQLRFACNAFLGEDSGGTWTVTIADLASGDVGQLTGIDLSAFGSTASNDDTFIYTNQYAQLSSADIYRSFLDGGVGRDTLNAAAVLGACNIDLVGTANGGAFSSIDGATLRILGGVEDAVTGDGNDVINGNDGANWLRSMRGDDQINGQGGADKMEGGSGADRLYGGADNDTIIGGLGVDVMTGDGGDDLVIVSRFDAWQHDTAVGGDGRDTLSFELDTDAVGDMVLDLAQTSATFTLYGRSTTVSYSGFENLTGAACPDILRGDDNGNVLVGRGHGDTLEGRAGDDTLNGGFVDVLDSRGDDGNDTINGGAGNDRIIASLGRDTVNGGDDFDTLDFSWVIQAVTASLATGIATFSAGGGWSDPYAGTQGGWGGLFQVDFSGIEGLRGGLGADQLTGDGAANRIDGVAGHDTLDGGENADRLFGGRGNDVYKVDHVGDRVFEDLNSGLDSVESLVRFTLADHVENLTLLGEGNVNAAGNAGNNAIIGNEGANQLIGLGGRDRLTGGSGADLFVFTALSDSGVIGRHRDTIEDFSDAQGDRISLRLLDADAIAGGDQAFRFVGAAGFSGQAGDLRAVQADGLTLVSGDVNGDRVADFAVALRGDVALERGDFVL